MPYKYIRKKESKYTQDDMDKAIQDVKNNGLSMYAAAKKYRIPTTTLYDKIKDNVMSNIVGRPTAIPPALEMQLADSLKIMEKWGFGLSREEVIMLVEDFVKKNKLDTPFNNNKPGKDWFIGFRKRNRLSIKKAQPVEYVRKKMTDPFVVSEYFKLLEETLTSLNLFQNSHLIWNLDETSLSLDPIRTKVVGAINKPCSRTTCGTGKENITVLTAVSAAGRKVSPLIVFKGKNVWDEWMAPAENYDFDLAYAASTKGWMESEIFYNYMKKILIPALGQERPVVIIYDGHSTHVDMKVVELAIENNVTILKLPPHTSHLLQPLDVAVFKSFKSKWDGKLVEWQRHNIGIKMPKKIFSQTFSETWQEVSPDVIKSGFKKAGICPYDPQVIPVDKYDPAAYRRFQKAHLSLQNPKILKEICLDAINTEKTTIPDLKSTNSCAENPTYLTKLAKNDDQTQSFVAYHTFDLPKCLQCDNSQPKEKKTSQIKIIENIKVNFEELLLEKIRQDKKENTLNKKKRVAKGAEVITSTMKKKADETPPVECIAKKRDLKDKGKLKGKQTDIAKPGTSGINKERDCKNKLKRKRKDSDSSTSVSDIISLHSEIGIDFVNNCDYEALMDEIWGEEYLDIEMEKEKSQTELEVGNPSEHKIMCDITGKEKLGDKDFKTKGKEKKGKGKGKKTKNGKENYHSNVDCDNQENYKTAKVQESCLRKNKSESKNENINKTDDDEKTPKEKKNKLKQYKTDKLPKNTNENQIEQNKTDDDEEAPKEKKIKLKQYKTDKLTENTDENQIEKNKTDDDEEAPKEKKMKLKQYKTDQLPENADANQIEQKKKTDDDEEAPKEKKMKPKQYKTDQLPENTDANQIEQNKTDDDEEAPKEEKIKLKQYKTDKLPENTDENQIEQNNYDENKEYSLNDTVLVRYFNRKKWTYYIGLIENMKQKDDETYYTINFLRTIKKPSLKFVQTKKRDYDEITELQIVKKVILEKSNENDKEFTLFNDDNQIYFKD